jgi:hypothetical protein
MQLEIKRRITDAILWTGEGESLRDANLRSADLRSADLRGADLRDANLRSADLRGADLRGADLRDANLRDANLRSADLRDADLRDADLRSADLGDDIPIIENIDKRILSACTSEGCKLDMSAWHTCKTTHCRAGWAIALAGNAGMALEAKLGSACAGSLIYAKSRPDKRIPNFYASDEDAMADLIACAAE